MAAPHGVAFNVNAVAITNHSPQVPLAKAMKRAPRLRHDLLICNLWLKARDPDMEHQQQAQVVQGLPYAFCAIHKKCQMKTCALEDLEVLLVDSPIEQNPLPLHVSTEGIKDWSIDKMGVDLAHEEATCKHVQHHLAAIETSLMGKLCHAQCNWANDWVPIGPKSVSKPSSVCIVTQEDIHQLLHCQLISPCWKDKFYHMVWNAQIQ